MVELQDVTEYLTYFPEEIDPTASTGLWFLADVIDVDFVAKNAVCLPLAGDWNDLEKCSEFFSAFKYVVIAIPDEERRAEAVEQLRRHVRSVPLTVVQTAGFHGKSIREIAQEGHDQLMRLIGDCVDVPGYGLLNLAAVKRPGPLPRIRSPIAELDKHIGGFPDGELSIWTGRRGEGKSTIAGQILLSAREQGRTVCAYSGELPAWRFKEWIYQQAAGPKNVEKRIDSGTGHEYYVVPDPVLEEIDAWLDRRFILLDSSMPDANNPEQIISAFKLAQRQHGASVFLADNLMSTEISTMGDKDFYRAQSAFVGRLVMSCNLDSPYELEDKFCVEA